MKILIYAIIKITVMYADLKTIRPNKLLDYIYLYIMLKTS